MSRPLTPAEVEQRRNAARARWAAAASVVGAASAGYGLPQAFLNSRGPTADEVQTAFRREGGQFMGAMRRAGATKQQRSAAWVGERRSALSSIKGSLRPISDRRVQTASAVALATLAAGIAAPSFIAGQKPTGDNNRAQSAVQWGGGVLGSLGGLRAVMPIVRRVPRSALAAAGLGAATIAAARKDA